MTIRNGLSIAAVLAATTMLASAGMAKETPSAAAAARATEADELARQFRDPPMEARPRVWWHWMNGNISCLLYTSPSPRD